MKKIINPGVFYKTLRVLSLRITNLFNSGPRLMKSAQPGNFVIDNKNLFQKKIKKELISEKKYFIFTFIDNFFIRSPKY